MRHSSLIVERLADGRVRFKAAGIAAYVTIVAIAAVAIVVASIYILK
jgi:hypothetical protein